MSDLNTISNDLFDRREAMRPNGKTWLKHAIFLLATFCTVTIAGTLYPFGKNQVISDNINPQTVTDFLLLFPALPYLYLQILAGIIQNLFANPGELIYGLKFSISLLSILTAHEAGHYVACRLYGVDATLPYFIPMPPMIGPAGTLGAFIKILSPLPSRRATFDIGVAGPIAGFIIIIPVAIIGFLTMQYSVIPPGANAAVDLYLSDPLLMRILAPLFGIDLSQQLNPNPFYMAAWLGLLITSLNLIPSGQLDGGHAVYAIFGERIHHWTTRIAFVAMIMISILGWFFYNSPSGLLFTVLLGIMLRIKHPQPFNNAPLDFKRVIVAILTLLIFALCFVPFPIQIN